MKKIYTLLIIFTLTFVSFFCKFSVKATNDSSNLTNPSTEFRAAWVSYYTGDISYKNEKDYKNQIDQILDTMEYYNMNAMIFHIRANHDAWYNSKINKVNRQLSNVDFSKFDPLEYDITEAHKRGIEFHAWMNPYRIGSTYASVEDVASAYSDYPNNPASKKENVLMGSTLQILNPGIPEVRDFIVDTCMEVVNNYDVDAIHFDDYFYASGINDASTIAKYNTEGLSTSDFRRKQVDLFIKDLKDNLDQFNKKNNKFVQLGISPTGVYKNASSTSEANTPLSKYVYNENGDLIYPTGATMGCQMHYESYLYCDTLKWVNNEWINYILPQTYWSTSHSRAPFEKLINWWNMAVKNKNVNLYAGMGIYMWKDTAGEAVKQLNITSGLENVLGTSIYSYGEINEAYQKIDTNLTVQMSQVKNKVWKNLTILPEIAGMDPVKLGSVNNFQASNNILSWDKLDGAKFYIIYRSNDCITYNNDEIVDIISSPNDIVSWEDSDKGEYVYDVVPLSYTNTLGEGHIQVAEESDSPIHAQISLNSDGSSLFEVARAYNVELDARNAYVFLSDDATDKSRLNYDWSSSDEKVATISEYGTITLKSLGTITIKGVLKTDKTKYCEFKLNVCNKELLAKEFTVNFKDSDGKILKTVKVKYGNAATAPENVSKAATDKYSYEFIGWNELYYNVTSDLDIIAVYKVIIRKYQVTYKNADGTILKQYEVPYGTVPTPPTNPTLEADDKYTYTFLEWSIVDQQITEDTIIVARYIENARLYTLSVNLGNGSEIKKHYYYSTDVIEYVEAEYVEGFEFVSWYYDDNFENECIFPLELRKDITIYAKYAKLIEVKIADENDNIIKEYTDLEENNLPSFDYITPKEGYRIIGWSIKENDKFIPIEKLPNSDCVIYPIYEKISSTINVKIYDEVGNLVHSYTANANDPLPSNTFAKDKNGYVFDGWGIVKGGSIVKITTLPDTDCELYPIYKKTSNCRKSCGTILLIPLTLLALCYFRKKH